VIQSKGDRCYNRGVHGTDIASLKGNGNHHREKNEKIVWQKIHEDAQYIVQM
jgi:hypothetical protein